MSEEKTEIAYSVFRRRQLKKLTLAKSDHGNFMLVTKCLDRDTLTVGTVKSFITDDSMHCFVWLYLTCFCEDKEGKIEI